MALDQRFDFFGGSGLNFQRVVVAGVAEDALDVLLGCFGHFICSLCCAIYRL
jgi:hypothetical protein